MTTSREQDASGDVIYAYTAQQGLDAGTAIEPFPEITRAAGHRLRVILTRDAYAAVVEWTRDDTEQDPCDRYRSTLCAAQTATKRALGRPGSPFLFQMTRVPNRAANGAHSLSQLPLPVMLSVRVEALDWDLSLCLVIALPWEA